MSSPLPCPCCLPPAALDSQGVCAGCGGRLVRLADLDRAGAERVATTAAASESSSARRTCPSCLEPMTAIDVRGVRLDRCQACAALWLDAGESEPGALTVAERALFALSLPERAARGLLGGVSGAVHEASQVLLPASLRSTRFYSATVAKSLRFLVEDVAGVTGRFREGTAPQVDVARAAVGGFLDTAGLAVLHVSPIWVLAAFSDVARGTNTYLRELNDELVRQRVLPEGTVVAGVEDLLQRLENVSGGLADTVDQPPLSVPALRQSLGELRAEIAQLGPDQLFPQREREQTWAAITELARGEGRSPFEVSAAITLASEGAGKLATGLAASVRVGGSLLHRGLLRHYLDTAQQIHDHGYWQTVASTSLPYLDGARQLLDPAHSSWTEDLLSGRLLRSLWSKPEV